MNFRTVAATLTAAVVLLGVPAPALAAVRIVKVQFNPPGRDLGSNSSLNDEWVRIRNSGAKARSLEDWTLRDRVGHVYRFGTLRLPAGDTVTVHTGRGVNTAHHRYWDAGWYVWNNDGDVAVLRNAAIEFVDRCGWRAGTDPVAC